MHWTGKHGLRNDFYPYRDDLEAAPTETDSLLAGTFSPPSIASRGNLLPPPVTSPLTSPSIDTNGRLELDLTSTPSHQARMWFNKVEAVVHLVGVLGVAVLCALSVWLTLADVHM